MSQIDKIKAQIALNHLRQLVMIDPYPEVIEALTEAVECFSFTQEHSNSAPMIVFYGNDAEEDEFEFLPSSLPRLYIQLLAPEPERFLMTIDLPEDDGKKMDVGGTASSSPSAIARRWTQDEHIETSTASFIMLTKRLTRN